MVPPLLQVASLEQGLDQPQEAVIVELFAQGRHEDRVVQRVETGANVPFDEPGRADPLVGDLVKGRMAAPVRAEAVGVWAELRVVIGIVVPFVKTAKRGVLR